MMTILLGSLAVYVATVLAFAVPLAILYFIFGHVIHLLEIILERIERRLNP